MSDPEPRGGGEFAAARVALAAIGRDESGVLQNLLELYVHDFSEVVPFELKPSGRFELAIGDGWWTRDDHFPFFIRVEGKLCGFALARRGSRITGDPNVMDVAEFFVVRGARRCRVGTRAAHELFATFACPWEVRVRRAHLRAHRFWAQATGSWIGAPVASEPIVREGVDWDVFRFAGRPAGGAPDQRFTARASRMPE